MATTTEQRSTVVGVFENRRQVDTAVSEIRQAGFREDQIGVARRHAEGETPEATTAEPGTHWETGAAAGALAGAGLGGLVGLGIMAGVIPAIGPVIAGGTLAAILANAAGGAVIGGLVGALVGADIPEEEARYYQSELEAGRTIVTVKADGATMRRRASSAVMGRTTCTPRPRGLRAQPPEARRRLLRTEPRVSRPSRASRSQNGPMRSGNSAAIPRARSRRTGWRPSGSSRPARPQPPRSPGRPRGARGSESARRNFWLTSSRWKRARSEAARRW